MGIESDFETDLIDIGFPIFDEFDRFVDPHKFNKFGTFDWEKFTASATIPADAEVLELVLGMQECQGTLWVDDLKITIAE